MANSIQLDPRGPDWPLGFISVATPGTPVGIMSLVDPSGNNSPNAPVPNLSGNIPAGTLPYSIVAQQIQFQSYKPGATHGTQVTTGNVYIVRTGIGSGTGNRDDYGSIVATLAPGQTYTLSLGSLENSALGPYRYSIDADNVGDGAFVTLMI